jgi:hypothetical protein
LKETTGNISKSVGTSDKNNIVTKKLKSKKRRDVLFNHPKLFKMDRMSSFLANFAASDIWSFLPNGMGCRLFPLLSDMRQNKQLAFNVNVTLSKVIFKQNYE